VSFTTPFIANGSNVDSWFEAAAGSAKGSNRAEAEDFAAATGAESNRSGSLYCCAGETGFGGETMVERLLVFLGSGRVDGDFAGDGAAGTSLNGSNG
jgi:hypothetical protein